MAEHDAWWHKERSWGLLDPLNNAGASLQGKVSEGRGLVRDLLNKSNPGPVQNALLLANTAVIIGDTALQGAIGSMRAITTPDARDGLIAFLADPKERAKQAVQAIVDLPLEDKFAAVATALAGGKGVFKLLPESPGVERALPNDVIRYSKRPPAESEVIGRFDPEFVEMGSQKKVNAAFGRIEQAFGSNYASRIRGVFNSVGVDFYRGHPSDDTLGVFRISKKGPFITLNTNIGNPEVFANVILHEVRHLRHYNKLRLSPREWDALDDGYVERFATATNVWQGRRLGMSPEDLRMFQAYYDGFRE